MTTCNIETLNSQDEKLKSAVMRFGQPVSLLLLNSPCSIFESPKIDGLVGYKIYQSCAVVIGDPLCSKPDLKQLTQDFHEYCKSQNWTIVYFLTSDNFANSDFNVCKTSLQVGNELDLNPLKFEKRPKLRWKINNSIQHGVTIHEYIVKDVMLENEMKAAMQKWQSARRSFQIYLDTTNLFESNLEKRIFYALREGKIVGLSVIIRIKNGYASTTLLSLDSTLNVTEHLQCHVIDLLASENCNFLCLGFDSGKKIGDSTGVPSFVKFFANLGFSLSRWIFHLDEKSTYLNKYHPVSNPTYLLASETLSLSELIAILKMLNFKL